MESVKAPFEFVSASFRRTQKQLSSEIKDVIFLLEGLPNKSKAESEAILKEVEGKITALFEVLDDADVLEKDQLRKIQARCQEYQPLSTTSLTPQKLTSSSQILSERRELILIGDFLLRQGQLDAVDALIQESGEWLEQMLDVQIYKTAGAVETSVLEGRLDLALKWVNDHASKLRRLNSALEFFIRQEQFLSLVHRGRSLEALRFAQTHLAPLVADKPPPTAAANSSEKCSSGKKERRSSSFTSECSDDGSMPPSTTIAATTTTISTPPRPTSRARPQRQRAASLGTPPTSRGGVADRLFSPYRPSRNSLAASGRGGGDAGREASSHEGPIRNRNSTTGETSASAVSLPFSFSANPLAFFRYSRGSSESSTNARGRSSSGSFTDFLSGDATFVPPSVMQTSTSSTSNLDSCEEAAQEQSAYMKEAMCHLMSLLAFMSQTDESSGGGTDDEEDATAVQVSKKCKGSRDSVPTPTPSLFGSMVPCLYDRMYTPHRRRCIVDLFRVEFRRVYSQGHVSALEQYVKMGVFALKTPACGEQSKNLPAKLNGDSNGNNGSNRGSSIGVIDALRYVRQSIRTARNRVRTRSSGSSSSSQSGGADDMEVETETEADLFERMNSLAGRTPPPSTLPSTHSGMMSPNSDEGAGTTHTSTLNGDSVLLPGRSLEQMLPECPVCTPGGQVISASIPVFAARSESVLVCRGSGRVMNHDNPPVALPNGQVFSKAFVMSQARPKDFFPAGEGLVKKKTSFLGRSYEPSPGPFHEFESAKRNGSSSIFEGCFCGTGGGGSLRTDASSPSRGHRHLPGQGNNELIADDLKMSCDENEGGDEGDGERPLSAIEVMMKMRRRQSGEAGVGVDRSSGVDSSSSSSSSSDLLVAALKGVLCGRAEVNSLTSSNTNNVEDSRGEQEGRGVEHDQDHVQDHEMSSDSPPLPPPPLFFTCPITGSTFDISCLKAVFIV